MSETTRTELGKVGWYVRTERVEAPDGPVVERVLHLNVQDDYCAGRDLGETVRPLLVTFQQRCTGLPDAGLAPWISAADEGGVVRLVRRFYPTKLLEHAPPPISDPQRVCDLLASVARAADAVGDAAALSPNNLFWDADHAVMTDYGLAPLIQAIEAGYDGPRVGSPISNLYWGCPLEIDRPRPAGRALRQLALLYYHLRTGAFLLSPDGADPDTTGRSGLIALHKAAVVFRKSGELEGLGALEPGEREPIRLALLSDDPSSCVELLEAISGRG